MEKIKSLIKGSRFLYTVYFGVMSAFVNLLRIFVKTDEKLILFVSYGGRHYSDSPRVIYEAMRKDPRFRSHKLVWAFVDPDKFDVANKIKIDSLSYYLTALKARCWVTNVIVERALKFKGKKTYYFHTAHGILPKLDGWDSKGNFQSHAKMQYDCSLVHSEYEKKISARIHMIDEDIIEIIGAPKNDIFANYTPELRESLRKKIGIPEGKKAILYAPTFRESSSFYERFDVNVDLWKKALGDDYVLLYRAHPVVESTNKQEDSFFIDCTKYEVVEELMIASDMLVSDYSGIIFDYSIMHKPIYLWTYDYEEYQAKRGLYFDIRQILPHAAEEAELLELLANTDRSQCLDMVRALQEKYITEYGHATEKSLDIIYRNMQT